MRRFIYGTVLAAFAMFSACEAVQPQEGILHDEVAMVEKADTLVFSASLCTDTKTNIVWSEDTQTYKTIWNEDDFILIYDENNDSWRIFTLIEGAGTTSAQFKGTISEQTRYTAVYTDEREFWGNTDYLSFNIQSEQFNESNTLNGDATFGEFTCPMVARSYDNVLNFRNMASVLCVRLTGNGETVSSVTFRPREGSSGAGLFEVGFDDDEPCVMWRNWDANSITVFAEATLGSTPSEFYFVLPDGTYNGGFDIVVETDMGKMKRSTSEDVEFELSQVRHVNLEWDEDYLIEWGLVGEMTGWENDILMTEEGDYWVLKGQYLEAWVEFKFRYGEDWTRNLGAYESDEPYELSISNAALLRDSGPNMCVSESGTYDIYLDVINEAVFVMNEGECPDGEIPEVQEVWSFVNLFAEWEDVEMVNEDGIWVLYDKYLVAGDYFKFRANKSWNINLGCDNGVFPPAEENMVLRQNGGDIRVETEGYYNLYLDVDNKTLKAEHLDK